jgi:hypothetical protein
MAASRSTVTRSREREQWFTGFPLFDKELSCISNTSTTQMTQTAIKNAFRVAVTYPGRMQAALCVSRERRQEISDNDDVSPTEGRLRHLAERIVWIQEQRGSGALGVIDDGSGLLDHLACCCSRCRRTLLHHTDVVARVASLLRQIDASFGVGLLRASHSYFADDVHSAAESLFLVMARLIGSDTPKEALVETNFGEHEEPRRPSMKRTRTDTGTAVMQVTGRAGCGDRTVSIAAEGGRISVIERLGGHALTERLIDCAVTTMLQPVPEPTLTAPRFLERLQVAAAYWIRTMLSFEEVSEIVKRDGDRLSRITAALGRHVDRCRDVVVSYMDAEASHSRLMGRDARGELRNALRRLL